MWIWSAFTLTSSNASIGLQRRGDSKGPSARSGNQSPSAGEEPPCDGAADRRMRRLRRSCDSAVNYAHCLFGVYPTESVR